MDKFYYRIETIDKIGVTLSILQIFYLHEINITKLELASKRVYISFTVKNNLQLTHLNAALTENPYCISYEPVDCLPSEKTNREIDEIFSKLEEDIIITDIKYTILKVNKPKGSAIFKRGTSITQAIKSPHVFELLSSNGKVSGVEVSLKNKERRHCSVIPFHSELNNETQYIWIFTSQQQIQERLTSGYLGGELNTLDDIVYKSAQMEKLIDLARMASFTDSNVLIRGESGTGKELFARGIHSESPRSNGPFVAVNCAAIPDSLLESELFGYEEGTFTGSKKNGKIGLFEQADTGTIFLDEIGDLSLHLQSKLLRIIETKSVRRIGGRIEIPLDIRIVAATHQPLEELIESKQFRLDLFYRLNVYNIHIAPLRLRKEDILHLSQFFLQRVSEHHGLIRNTLTPEAELKLLNHSWRGNVRELENTIERTAVLSQNEFITDDHIQFSTLPTSEKPLLEAHAVPLKTYAEMFEDFEKNIFNQLSSTGRSSREIAKLLRVSHTTIANKLRKYKLT